MQNSRGKDSEQSPLPYHPLDEKNQFRPEDLVASVRRMRGLAGSPVPEICILEFDGDLTDALISRGEVQRFLEWPCFHTTMWHWAVEDFSCGIVARTIGGPFAVLVAEQLFVCGARVVVGITSAGRVSARTPVPGIVVAERALRDEGTSLHHLSPSRMVEADQRLAQTLADAIAIESLPLVRGAVWTTDAPYRETARQIDQYSREGILAVEMQAASLFAFAQYRSVPVGLVAHVTNGGEHSCDFDKRNETERCLLGAVCRGAKTFLGEDVKAEHR